MSYDERIFEGGSTTSTSASGGHKEVENKTQKVEIKISQASK